MKILIYGIGGKMGQILYRQISASEDTVCAGVDKFADKNSFTCPIYENCNEINEKTDCIIDFSVREAIYDYLPYAVKNSIPCVIATTGHSEIESDYIENASKTIPIFKSGNMSIGINLLLKLVKQAEIALKDRADVEIVETHHRRKVDAPSGTALMIAKAIQQVADDRVITTGRGVGSGKRSKQEIGISSVRGGTVAGIHEVKFLLDNEVITITHNAEDRTIFADGSIDAAHFIVNKKPGIYSQMD